MLFCLQDVRLVAGKVDDECLRTTVRTFIRLFMTRSLACTFSWSGLGAQRKKVKKSFKGHDIFLLLQRKFVLHCLIVNIGIQ